MPTESQLRILVENSPDHFFIQDRQLRYTYVLNPQLGMSVEGMLGKTDSELAISDADAERLTAIKKQVLEGHTTATMLIPVETRQGQTEYFEGSYSPVRDEDGTIEGIAGYFRNVTQRQQTELALAESEARSRMIVQHVPLGMFQSTREGQFIYTNPALARILGYASPEELMQKVNQSSIAEALYEHPDERPTIVREVVEQAGGWRIYENRYRRKDGRIIDAILCFGERRDPISGAPCLFGFVEDITDEKRIQEQLRKSEERYRDLLQNIHAGVVVHAADTSIIMANEHASLLLGLTMDQMMGKKAIDSAWCFMDDDMLPMSLDEYPVNQVIASGEPLKNYVVGINRPQTHDVAWVQVDAFPKFAENGELTQVVVTFVDITKLKHATLAAEKHSQRLDLARESSMLGVWDWDVTSNVMTWDDRMCELYGTTPETFSKNVDAWTRGLHPEDKDRAVSECNQALEGKGEFHTTFRVIHPDGKVLHLKADGKVITDGSGKAIRMIGINSDITAAKQAEKREKELRAELARAKRMEAIGLLAGGVAHDLNNTLGPLAILPDLLAEDLADLDEMNTETTRETLEVIKSSADRAAAIVKDLVSLARRQSYHLVQMDLSDVQCLSTDCHTIRQLQADYNDVIFSVQPHSGPLIISGDESHLSRAATNLVRNAAEAINEKGSVTIRTFKQSLDSPYPGYETVPPGNYAVIEISDTGDGIEEESLERIFEPFYTKKKKSERSGSGLGLSLVYGIVKDHNGFVDVDTVPLKGSVFSLYIPLAGESKTEDQKTAARPMVGGTERILVVDDEPGQRFLCRMSLERLGYAVTEARHGHQAVALFEKAKAACREAPYDLLVIDVIMEEGFDGLEAYEEILKLYPCQKAIIASGHAEIMHEEKAKQLGAGWLDKPYQKEDIAKAVRTRLDETPG